MGILKTLSSSILSIFLSRRFKFLHLIFLVILAPSSLLVPNAHPAQVTLAWDANPDPSVTGYKVHYGTSSGIYQEVIDTGNVTSWTIPNLSDGIPLYFAVTDYTSSGTESGYSNEVVYNPSSACDYSISPTDQSFNFSGGSGTVKVTTQTGCTWAANSNASWILITSNGSKAGSAAVNYSISLNDTTTSRSGTVSIAGKTFKITQGKLKRYFSTQPRTQ